MNTSRLAIFAGLAVAIAVIAALQTCRDEPAGTPAEPVAKAAPQGVPSRPADSPVDLRDRDRLRESEVDPAGVIATPDPAPAPEPVAPERERRPDEAANAEPPTAVGPPPSPTIEAAMAAAKAAAQDEVAKARGEMRRKCWDGVDRGGKGADGVPLSFSLSFDAEGHVIASSVQQKSREDYIPGLENCLAPFAHAVEVPAPGESVSVEVDLDLP